MTMEAIRTPAPWRTRLLLPLLLAILAWPALLWAEASPVDMARWIAEMKEEPRGPFERIRWFCKDGTTLPPGPYACARHGGGIQHGQLNDRAEAMQEAGYPVGTVLASTDPVALAAPEGRDRLKAILLERYLIAADDGWILRQARYYRGAFQIEDEQAAAQALLTELARQARDGRHLLLLRQAAMLLPGHGEEAALTRIHALSTTLAERDPSFEPLRNKIHAQPDAGDAERVLRHAGERLSAEHGALAEAIERLFHCRDLSHPLRQTADRLGTRPLARRLRQWAASWSTGLSAEQRLATSASMLVDLREALPGLTPGLRLAVVDLGIDIEAEVFAAGRELLDGSPGMPLARRLGLIGQLGDALYGVGLLSARERLEIQRSIREIGQGSVPPERFRAELRHLDRVPLWAGRELAFHFAGAVEHLAAIEPKARHFMPDRLRASPLLVYSALLDGLLREAQARAGIEHTLFDQPVGAGLRSLNPGLARGVLRLDARDPGPDSIVLLPETTSELPPVAGILTREEGNALSHVQILAGNLGIPNVVVDAGLLPLLRPHDGQRVILAVSPGGRVLMAEDGPRWEAAFERQEARPERLRADLGKLDLAQRTPIPLDRLRADDAGRVVGPKAAKLGELKHLYPEAVSGGLAIPFGVFRALLDQPMPGSDASVFEWMRGEYRRIEALPADQRLSESAILRERLRGWIEAADPGPGVRQALREAMEGVFGTAGHVAVFVRSDTNVEDQPGFSGAGLNLTLPNVVGFEAILRAIQRVWASPFSERAFSWRQMRMDDPEHIYVSVLLQQSVPVEKSGVMLTMDTESGRQDAYTVAVNEGVGGAVSGQGAEEWLLGGEPGASRLLSEASATTRRALPASGGMKMLPVSGRDHVLEAAEIEILRALANELPKRFPMQDAEGQPLPADVEFGFLDGRLALFQIRPYQQSREARRNAFLLELDRPLREGSGRTVNMGETR